MYSKHRDHCQVNRCEPNRINFSQICLLLKCLIIIKYGVVDFAINQIPIFKWAVTVSPQKKNPAEVTPLKLMGFIIFCTNNECNVHEYELKNRMPK